MRDIKSLKELNNLRKNLGLKELTLKEKKCSKCGVKFQTCNSDICCLSCKKTNNLYFNYYGAYGENNE